MKAHEYMYTIRENFEQYGIQLHQDGANIIFDFPNPYGGEAVTVCFDKEQFTLYFGRYHAHFCYDDEDFEELQNILNGIFQCRYAVVYCVHNEQSVCCALGDLSGICNFTDLINLLQLEDLTDNIAELQTTICYWNPVNNKIIHA